MSSFQSPEKNSERWYDEARNAAAHGNSRDEVASQISTQRMVLTPSGDLLSSDAALGNSSLFEYSALVRLLSEKSGGESPLQSSRILTSFGIAESEKFSDRGHLRFSPKGALMYELIREWHSDILLRQAGSTEIKTPALYKWKERLLQEEAGSFAQELYYVYPPSGRGGSKGASDGTREAKDNDEFVLRFGGDFGLFSLLQDTNFSYRHLPWRVHEFAPSFRYERSGNLSGLQRARAFGFYDIHSICGGLDQGWSEFASWYKLHAQIGSELGMKLTSEFTVVESFWLAHKDKFESLVKETNFPVAVEVISAPKHYWVVKYMFYDQEGREFFNNQLDFANGHRFDLGYANSDGKRQACSLCHASLGSVERWIVQAFESALEKSKDRSVLPLWLSPTQLRIISHSEGCLDESLKWAQEFNIKGVRADVDDRKKNVGDKINAAREDWCPYVVVLGPKELQDKNWSVKCRATGDERVMSPAECMSMIASQTVGMPFRPFHPLLLSKRPKF